MTENEKRVLQYIQENPFISQQELSQRVGLSRPSVANIISTLVKKGYLLGKAYVVNESKGVICIGAANVDKKLTSDNPLVSYTSNPVHSKVSVGGVARNVAENLGRLGQNVQLITTVGYDAEWQTIKEASQAFMNVDHVIQLENSTTGTYTALLDEQGEMYLGLADMSIYDKMTPDLLMRHANVLQRAKCIVIDLNCPKETVDYVCALCMKHAIKLVVVAVSEPKMNRMTDNLAAIDCLIINKGEMQAYFNEIIETEADAQRLAQQWIDKGVKQVVLTAGSKKLLVASNTMKWYGVKRLDDNQVVDVTGAGDSFTAAYVDGLLNDLVQDDCVLAGLTNAYHTIQSSTTVRQNLTKEQLQREMQEYVIK